MTIEETHILYENARRKCMVYGIEVIDTPVVVVFMKNRRVATAIKSFPFVGQPGVIERKDVNTAINQLRD